MAKKKTFEEAVEELEAIAAEIEKNELPLGELLKEYKKGLKLAEFCRAELDDANRTVCELQKVTQEAIVPMNIEGGGLKDE